MLWRQFNVLFGFLVALPPLPALAQGQITSQIIVTGRSLAVEPATNYFAAPGGVTTFLTTYDGSSGPVLSPFSGEAKPQYLGSSNYVTDYEGHLGIMDPSGMLVNYGELVISNMPVTVDSDGDGLPDFLEKNLPSSFSVDASDREDYRFNGNTNNSEWTLAFSRSADSHAGTYTLRKKSDPENPEKIWNGNFQLKGGAGTVSFDTMGRTFSMSTDSFDRQYPEANDGTGVYGVTADGKLLVSGFWLNSSFGPTRKIYINPFLVQRIGTTDRGRAVLYSSDGHAYDPSDSGSTPYPDYTEFHLEVAGLSNSLTQTPTLLSSFPWNDDFSSTTSSNNYLDFRHSHFARLDVSGDKLNLVSSGHPVGENYGNLSIYSPPYLLLPLDSSWDLSVQVALPAPDGAYYKGVGVSLAPENDTYDIANFGATVYSFELGQDDDPATPGTFLATYARKDWVEDQNLGQLTSVSFNTAFLRFSYNSSTKILSAYYDDNVSSPNRNWKFYQDLNVDPADPTSVAADLGLTSSSKIRMALWADAYVTTPVSAGEIWMDSLSITQKQSQTITFDPLPLKTVGDPAFGLVASASSNLGITFTSSDPSVAEVNGSNVTIKAPGLVTLTAFQAGDANYVPTTATQNLMIIGSPISPPFADDFSSLIPNRYFFYGEASTGHQFQVANGVLRFSANAGGTYDSGAATGPNLALPLSGNWTISVDATMPGGSWSPTDVWLYLSLQKNDGAFVDYFTQGTNRIKATSLKLLREGTSTVTYVNAHNYDSTARWDFESSTNNLGPDARTVTLGWTYSATDKKLQAWYDPDTTNSPAQGWILLHEFSTDPTVADSLGQKWSLNLASDTLTLSLSATSLDPTAGQDIYFDNLSVSSVSGGILPQLPTSLTRRSGQELYLSISPRDAGTFTYDWTKDGAPLPGGFLQGNGTLYKPNLASSDAGIYQVTVLRNGAPYGTSSSVLSVDQNGPGPTGSDDFSTETGRWSGVYGLDAHDSYLKVANGKLQLVMDRAGSANTQAIYFWAHRLPSDLPWEATVDTFIDPSISTNWFGLRMDVGLPVDPQNPESQRPGLGIRFFDDRNSDRLLQSRKESVGFLTSQVTYQTNRIGSASHVTLRLTYNPANQTLYSSFRIPPATTWTDFEQHTISGVSQTEFAKGFILELSTLAEPSFVLTQGQANFDNFSASIIQPPVPPPALVNGLRANLGQSFSYLPTFSGSQATFTATNLPNGLSLNPSTGEISGTPSTAGYYRAILTASNPAGSANLVIPITIPATAMSLSLRDDFSSTLTNRYMPLYNLAAPSELVISNGSLRFISIQSDSDGSLAAWIPNLPLPLTNSWDVVVDAKMPSGWDTPYAGVGLTLMPYEETGTIESTGMQRRLNLKLGRDTEDPIYAGNYFARAAYTNNEEYVFPPPGASLPFVTSNTPATQAALRYSFHAPTKTLSTWYRTNGATSWEQLGTPYDLNPFAAGSLGHAWGLSNSSTLRVALWGDSNATNGSAGQAIELDNFYAAVRTGLIEPALPATLARRPHSPIYLSASPRDLGTYTYLWKKNGAPLPPLLGMAEHLATYYLPNPTTSDDGTYELTIFREDGEVYGTSQTVLTISPTAPEGPRSDDFSSPLGRWNGVWGFDLHDSYFKRSDEKLQLVLDKSNGNNTQSFYIWDTPLPTDRSWEATVDANLASDIQLPSGQYIYHSLRLVADIPLNKNDGLSALASGLSVEFAEDSDSSSGRIRYVQNVASTTNEPGYEILPSNPLDSWRRVVSLRIRYDSQTKTLSSFYALPFGLLSAPGTITLGPGPGSITLGPGLSTITSGPGTIVLGPGSGTLTLNSGSGTILTPTSAPPPWSSPGLSGTTSVTGTHSLSPASVTADGSGVASGDSLNISGGSIVISGDSVVVSGGSQSVSGGSLVISGGSLVISGGSLTLAPTWNLAATTNLSSLPPAQLTNGFRLMLSSLAEPSLVIQEGQAYFDNFTLKYDLSVSNAAVVTKSFDGSRSATITGTLVGVVAGDSVDHDGAGLFDTPAPGVNKPVTANLTLTGTESAHYTITQPTGLTGTIQSLSEIFFGNLDPTTVASDGLTYLMKYAYGAADPTSPISQNLRPVTTLSTDTNGQPVLALTYYARTNDTNLSIQPVWNANLSAPAADWASNVVVTTLGTTTNTNGLVLERRQATVPVDSNSKKFLRLKTTLKQ